MLYVVGCSATKKIEKSEKTDISHDRIVVQKEVIIERDTTIIYRPAKEKQQNMLFVIGDTASYLSTDLARSWAIWKDGILDHGIQNKDTIPVPVPRYYNIHYQLGEIVDNTTLEIKDVEIKEVEKYRLFNPFFYTSGFIGWIILILSILWNKLKRR